MDLPLQILLDPTVFLTGIFFILVGWYILQPSKSYRYPPGPRPWPLVGNLPLVTSSKKFFYEILLDMHNRHGDVVRLKLGPFVNFISIRGRAKVHKAFVEMNDTFKYRPRKFFVINHFFKEKGVFFGNGDSHTALRKFTLGALRDFGVGKKGIEARIQEEVGVLVDTMMKDKGTAVNYRNLFKKAVNNIIANIIYGMRFEYDDPRAQELINNIDFFFKTLTLGLPENAFPFLRHLPGSKIAKVRAVFNDLEKYGKTQIQRHRETFDPDNIRDFVDIFLQNEGSDDSALNEDNLFRVIIDLFNAGTDTTATTFVWTIVFLLRQPEIQDKCRKEILEVVGEDRIIGLEDKHNLPYLQALINETLRYCTIAPTSAPHTVLQDTEFEGYIIPKDSVVVVHLNDLLNNKEVWGDPENFRPERFLSESGKLLETTEDFSPFSLGGRSCLGKQLAKTELFIFLGTLIQRFEFRIPKGQGLPSTRRIQTGVTSQPAEFEVCAVSLDS